MREEATADFLSREVRLLEDDDARSRARQGARRRRAREAPADDGDVAILLQGRLQRSSQAKGEAFVTRAPGRIGAAIAAISSGV